jgi:hypothetical protein
MAQSGRGNSYACFRSTRADTRQLGLSSGSYYVLHMVTLSTAVTIASALIPMAWSQGAPIVVGVLVLTIWLAAIAPLAMASYARHRARTALRQRA